MSSSAGEAPSGCGSPTASRLRVPSSSTLPWSSSQDHADPCDGGDRSSPSELEASPLPSSSALPSRQQPSAGDQGHQGATFHAPCDDGGDRSSPASSWTRC